MIAKELGEEDILQELGITLPTITQYSIHLS